MGHLHRVLVRWIDPEKILVLTAPFYILLSIFILQISTACIIVQRLNYDAYIILLLLTRLHRLFAQKSEGR